MFVPPMLAHSIPKGKTLEIREGEWAAEEKYDGMRIIVEVGSARETLLIETGVRSWSRDAILHPLPAHLEEAMSHMPSGIYDGELLVPGLRSYGSARLENKKDLHLILFDILRFKNIDTTEASYAERRRILRLHTNASTEPKLQLAESRPVNNWAEVYAYRDEVWSRDGEGLILKRIAAPYRIGKRSRDFIKIKKLQTAVLTVTGFEASRGLIDNRGRFAIVNLIDDNGVTTTVKTKNNEWCRKFEEQALSVNGPHPSIGRRLQIEYQELTPDGYRHPRWDRWENE